MHRTRAITIGSITAIVLAAAVALAATTGLVGGVATSTDTSDPVPVSSTVASPAEDSTPAPGGAEGIRVVDDDEVHDREDGEDWEDDDHGGRPGSASDESGEADDD